jgi:ABC-type transport system involved in multi-copper enzyme maturation permease subunit
MSVVHMSAVVDQARAVTQARVVRSEWTKLRTLRSTWWVLGVTVLCTVGIGALISLAAASQSDASTTPSDVAARIQAGSMLAQLVLAVLAVLVISGEYGTGMIRASMTAVPKRLPVLWAKAATLVAVVLPLTVVTSFAAWFLGEAVWEGKGRPAVALSDPGVLRITAGTALYLTLASVIALGLATVLRSTAAGIGTVVGLFFVLPILVAAFGSRLGAVGQFLPSNAGGALTDLSNGDRVLSPAAGALVLGAYAAVALGAAAWRLTRSDV